MLLNLEQIDEMIISQERKLQLKIDTLKQYQEIDAQDDLLEWSKHRVEISAMALVRLKAYKLKVLKHEHDKLFMELMMHSRITSES